MNTKAADELISKQSQRPPRQNQAADSRRAETC